MAMVVGEHRSCAIRWNAVLQKPLTTARKNPPHDVTKYGTLAHGCPAQTNRASCGASLRIMMSLPLQLLSRLRWDMERMSHGVGLPCLTSAAPRESTVFEPRCATSAPMASMVDLLSAS